MKTVPLTNSEKVAIVDDCDFERVSAYKWALHVKGYAYCRFWDGDKLRTIYMHRFLAGATKGDGKEVDHWDHDGLNNRQYNLRVATKAQNKWNMRVDRKEAKTSQFKGVSRHTRDERWVAHIRIQGKTKYLGLFEDEREAAAAYDTAAKAGFGEFACMNNV